MTDHGARITKQLAGLLALGCAIALVAGCGGGTSTSSTTAKGTAASGAPVKVGAVLSLTGTYAGLGTPEQNAIKMEVDRINAAGGINGRPLEVVIEDDATDANKAVAAATKLIDKDGVVAILGATGTGQSMAMRQEIDRAKIPQVSMAGGNVITGQFDTLVFQTPWPNRIVVPVTLDYMKKQGITKIGLLTDSGGYGKDGRDITLKNVGAYGVTVVADETFNPGDTDMTTQLTKIKAKGPQAIWMWSAGKEAAIIAKNLKQIDPKGTIKLFGTPGNGRVEFAQGAGDAANGVTFAAGKILLPASYGAGTPAYKVATSFVDRYTKAYGKAPDIFAGHAYDALNITAEAAKRVQGEVTPAALRDAIEQTQGFVGMGGTFNYSPTDHNGLSASDLVMYRVENGTWKLAQ